MKPSERQNLEREEKKQQLQKEMAHWSKVVKVYEAKTPEDQAAAELAASLSVLRMFPGKSKKEHRNDVRKEKKKVERRRRKQRKKEAVARARGFVSNKDKPIE